MNILLTGFGPFRKVQDNPSARLVQALNGRSCGPARLHGHVLPVTYEGGPTTAVRLARDLQAAMVIGFGVAVSSAVARVERKAVRRREGLDVTGQCPVLEEGPEEIYATADTARLARLLSIKVSEDAGQYVCNAWLYHVTQELSCPVCFVHIPPQGLAPERFQLALSRYLAAGLNGVG